MSESLDSVEAVGHGGDGDSEGWLIALWSDVLFSSGT